VTDDLKIAARRPVEPFDELMIRGETDPRTRSTLMGVFLLDRAPDWDRIVAHWERVTRLVLPLRQRIVTPTVPVTSPVWVVDPDFDLGYHLRRLRLPQPGGLGDVLELLEPLSVAPMDTSRPLWECTLVTGLTGDQAVWVTRMHHAVADGVGGQALATLAFDLERDPPPAAMPPAPVPEDITPSSLIGTAVRRAPLSLIDTALRSSRRGLRLAEGIVRHPRGSADGLTSYAASLRRIVAGPGISASPLLQGRSLRRRLLVLDVPFDDLRNASKAAGGSMNDGFLSAVCGALRRYHQHHGVVVEAIPVAIPINVRTDGDPAGGNRWAGARIALPVGDPDPAARIQAVRAAVKAAREEPALNAFSAMAPVAVRVPTWALATVAGDAGGGLDLQISNVPGSPVSLFLAGAEVLALYPFGPVPGPAAMITVHTYRRHCFVGVNLDPAGITEPELFMSYLQEGIDEVLALGAPAR
jgi:diacylglycerol O-acyltransferase / wax synthase